MKKIWNKYPDFCHFLATFAITAAIIFAFAGLTGIRLCAVQSGSMEPTIPTYSLCLITTHVSYQDIETGDIVVFKDKANDRRIIHRVIRKDADGAVTKGDANYVEDGKTVTGETLYGRYLFHVPGLARITNFFRTPIGIVILTIVFIWSMLPSKSRKDKEKTNKSDSSRS